MPEQQYVLKCKLTPSIQALVSSCPDSALLDKSADKMITVNQLISLYQSYRARVTDERRENRLTLRDVLKDFCPELCLAYPPDSKAHSPTSDARRQLSEYRAALENIKYQNMVRSISSVPLASQVSTHNASSFGTELREIQQQQTLILNILFSAAGTFVAVFWALDQVCYASVEINMLLGLLAAAIVVVCEVFLFYRLLFGEPLRAKQAVDYNK